MSLPYGYDSIVLPKLNKVLPKLVAKEITSVQPISDDWLKEIK